MKIVGVIGGLGPETTAKFYLEIIAKCYQITKEQRPSILIWNIPLKYEIEEELIEKAIGEEKYIPYLIEGAKMLEKAGADLLVMPCNTLHIFIEKIRKSVKIPVLSMIEETAKFLKKENISKIGILATTKTLQQKLYDNILKKYNIKGVIPEEKQQAKMGKIINNILFGRSTAKDKKQLLEIIGNFKKQGLKNVILACTELEILIKAEDSPIAIYNPMGILSEATVREILRNDTQ